MNAKVSIRDFSLLIALVAIWGFFAWQDPNFLSARNLSQLSIELSTTAVAALGMLLVILLGHIDLSMGSSIGLVGGIAAVLIQRGWPVAGAMAEALAGGLALYLVMGLMVAKERVPAFIITLAGLLVFRGLFWLVIGSQTIPVKTGEDENLLSALTTYYFPAWVSYALVAGVTAAAAWATWRSRARRRSFGFQVEHPELAVAKVLITFQVLLLVAITLNQFRGLPLSVAVLGVMAFLIWLMTQHTRFGRWLYAAGGNVEAARISGVPVAAITIGAFLVAGLCAGVTGFMQTAYAGASTTTTGDLMELDAVAACVIGGTSLMGGRGSVVGVLAGAFLIASLMNGLNLMAVAPEVKFIARGTVLALAVWMDVRLSRR